MKDNDCLISRDNVEEYRSRFKEKSNPYLIEEVNTCFMYKSYNIINDMLNNPVFYGRGREDELYFVIALCSIQRHEMSYFFKAFPFCVNFVRQKPYHYSYLVSAVKDYMYFSTVSEKEKHVLLWFLMAFNLRGTFFKSLCDNYLEGVLSER